MTRSNQYCGGSKQITTNNSSSRRPRRRDTVLVAVTGSCVTYLSRVCPTYLQYVGRVVTYLQYEGFLAWLFAELLQNGFHRQVWALPIYLQQTESLQTFLRH